MQSLRTARILLISTILMTPACDDENERIAEMAQEHARSQAEQTRETTKIQRELAEGARKLVEADARAREEMTVLQRELQTERVEIGRQRDTLEADRKGLASQRRMDPIIAAAIQQVGMTFVCVLPLIVCWYLLRHRPTPEETEELVTQVLIHELISSEPTLLAPPTAQPALPYREKEVGDSLDSEVDRPRDQSSGQPCAES